MASNKKGFTLIELLIVIGLISLVSILLFSIIRTFSKANEVYQEKAKVLQRSAFISDYIIPKLDEGVEFLSYVKNYQHNGNNIIVRYPAVNKDDETIKRYGIFYREQGRDELRYFEFTTDEYDIVQDETNTLIARDVSKFNVYFNNLIPEQSNMVVFSYVLFYKGEMKTVSFNFTTGHCLRNKR